MTGWTTPRVPTPRHPTRTEQAVGDFSDDADEARVAAGEAKLVELARRGDQAAYGELV